MNESDFPPNMMLHNLRTQIITKKWLNTNRPPAAPPSRKSEKGSLLFLCLNTGRKEGSYTSPALAAASYPFVDLPPGNPLHCKLFPSSKFYNSSIPKSKRSLYNEVNDIIFCSESVGGLKSWKNGYFVSGYYLLVVYFFHRVQAILYNGMEILCTLT